MELGQSSKKYKMAMKAIACGLILISFMVGMVPDGPARDALLLGASLIFTLSTTHNPGKMGAGLGLCGSLLLLSSGLVMTFANKEPQPLAVTLAMLLFVCVAASDNGTLNKNLSLVKVVPPQDEAKQLLKN